MKYCRSTHMHKSVQFCQWTRFVFNSGNNDVKYHLTLYIHSTLSGKRAERKTKQQQQKKKMQRIQFLLYRINYLHALQSIKTPKVHSNPITFE